MKPNEFPVGETIPKIAATSVPERCPLCSYLLPLYKEENYMRELEDLLVHLEQAPPTFQTALAPTHCFYETAGSMCDNVNKKKLQYLKRVR